MPLPESLVAGHRRFLRETHAVQAARYAELAEEGQRPHALVVSCCDSRVDPEAIFDAGPGEIFVLRNVANVVPPYEPDGGYHGASAAIEFAVEQLEVPAIVVLGHARCGGIQAALEGAEGTFLSQWIRLLDDVEAPPDLPPEERLAHAERHSIARSLERLMTFPFVRSRVEAGTLTLHGAHIDIASGLLEQI